MAKTDHTPTAPTRQFVNLNLDLTISEANCLLGWMLLARGHDAWGFLEEELFERVQCEVDGGIELAMAKDGF